MIKKVIIYFLISVALLGLVYLVVLNIGTPSNEREWQPQLAQLASVEIQGDNIKVKNVRQATYHLDASIDKVTYKDRTYKLSDLRTLDYFVTPFGGKGVAHTILSFGFGEDLAVREYIALSVEARKEIGEDYSLLPGMLNQYEIQYIWADEIDVVRTRVEDRNEATYRYNLDNVDQKNLEKLFLQLAKRTNDLSYRPEFYHTIWNNCTIDLWQQVNLALPDRLPWTWSAILPEKSGEYLTEQGLMSKSEIVKTLDQRQVKLSEPNVSNYSIFIRS